MKKYDTVEKKDKKAQKTSCLTKRKNLMNST